MRRHVRLRGFYWNGWSKGCGNASRGTTFEPGAGDSFYLTPSVAACRMCSRCMCPAYVFYPAEEPSEGAGAAVLGGACSPRGRRRRCGLGGACSPRGRRRWRGLGGACCPQGRRRRRGLGGACCPQGRRPACKCPPRREPYLYSNATDYMAAMLLAEAVDGEDTVCAHDGAHEGRGWRGELNERDQILIPPNGITRPWATSGRTTSSR